MTAHSSTSTDFTLRTLPKADRVEELRRQMAAIPGRSVEPATPMSLAVPASKPAAASAESILRLLPVAPAFAKLLPRGGLPRGSVVSVTGARSVLVSLVAEVTGSGGHAAVIGLPQFGLLSAVEMGADLTKCALIPESGADSVDVAAVLLDGMDLVVLGLGGMAVTPSRARAVVARARNRGSVLVVTEGRWDGADVRIDSRVCGYDGLGEGHGRVKGVRLDVEVSGRGFRPRTSRVDLGISKGVVGWSEHAEELAASLQPLREAL